METKKRWRYGNESDKEGGKSEEVDVSIDICRYSCRVYGDKDVSEKTSLDLN